MGIFTFFGSFSKEKLNQVGQSFTQKIVAWDPETASQAEIEEMIRELDKITAEAGKALAEYEREQREADTIRKNFDRYMAAAELLNRQVDEAKTSGDTAKSEQLGRSMDKLIGELESMKPEVDRELNEANEAKAYFDEVKGLAEMTAGKLKNARQMLDRAKRDMRRSEIDQQRAKARADKAEGLAGLRRDSSSLGIALEAMNKQAEETKAKAAASDMKAKLLTTPEKDKDDHIEAALKMVATDSTHKALPENFTERLKALKE